MLQRDLWFQREQCTNGNGKLSLLVHYSKLGNRVVISVSDRVFKKSTVQPTSVHIINISML